MRKLFMFLMAAFLLVGIAACNGDATTTGTPTTVKPTEKPTEKPITTVDDTTEYDIPEGYVLAEGLYNYKFASADVRHTFMAAAERYLMTTGYGGIPLFANGGFNLYASRLQLPIQEYIPVMGFGTGFSTMTQDDSKVKMSDGNPGTVGEYTYRTAFTINPVTWNQWIYDGSVDSDYMSIYMDQPYTYQFNEEKTGYVLAPSMMEGVPTPIDSRITETGKEVSKTWRFEVKEGLEWFFHPDTDMTGITDTVIDANDFVETYKMALEKGWFRAISGGGDFINSSMSIKNAGNFNADPKVFDWADVGITLIDDNTFEFEFENEQSEWNVKYFMGSFVMSPVQTQLVTKLGVNYGTSNTTIAYHGAYYVDYYEADKTVVMKKNPSYHNPTEFFFTGYDIQIIEDSAVRFQEFVAGKLEAISLPTENFDAYKNHPGLKRVPGATTFRMMINGLGTVEEQTRQFPGSTFVPEPLLANDNFKKALFFSIDRKYLAETVLKTSQTQMYLFSDAYLVEAEEGIPYRQTPQGLTVGEGLAPGQNGYNKDAAVALWKLALDDLVAAGTYKSGDTITMDYYIFSGSAAQGLMGTYIKDTLETTFNAASTSHNIKVAINVEPKDFPGIYYDYMMTGNFDLAIGGISGSTLDAASFLDVFTDDDRGGFTLNWGIDTSTANIPVKYSTNNYDESGNVTGTNYHHEMWSFNAITAILNGQVFILNGAEAKVPNPEITKVTPTTMEFTINEFTNAAYKNLKYTVQEWDQEEAKYVDVNGMVDITPASANVVLTGLNPYPYDYQITVYYDLASGENTEPLTQSTWDYSGEVVKKKVTTVDFTEIVIDITYDNSDREEGFERTIDSIKVFDLTLPKTPVDVTGDVTIVEDGTKVTVSGLETGVEYKVVVETDDAFTNEFVRKSAYEFVVSTKSIIDTKEVVTDSDSAKIDLDLGKHVFKSIIVKQGENVIKDIDFEASGLTYSTYNFALEGLEPNTKYTVIIKTDEGVVQKFVFETKSVIVETEVEVTDKTAEVQINIGNYMLKTVTIKITDGLEVKAYSISANGLELSVIDFELEGLTAETEYTVTVVTTGDLTDTFTFKTAKTPVAEE